MKVPARKILITFVLKFLFEDENQGEVVKTVILQRQHGIIYLCL